MHALRLLPLAMTLSSCASAKTDYTSVLPQIAPIVQAEMREWNLGGIAVAITDGTELLYAEGFGEAQRDSVFRAGSISKLFNAIAVMQLAEEEWINLDAPLALFPGATVPANPFPDTPPVTLRQLLCHRSGFQRESPTGGYFDDTAPSLAATCRSVAGCALATVPAAKTRYSNIAPSMAGHIVATVSGRDFAAYQKERILGPLGMSRSAWTKADIPGGTVIPSHMRIADGKGGFTRANAPLFDLGTLPAGNLYATAPDLAQLCIAMARATRGETTVLKPATFADMWKVQLDDTASFGLGFITGKYRSHRTIGHNGAVYGHSTLLTFLPEQQLGVVVLINDDIVNARASRIGNALLPLLLQAKNGEAPPPPPAIIEVPAAELENCAGHYESQSFWAELKVTEGRLTGNYASQPCSFAPLGSGKFLLRSRIHDDVPVTFSFDPAGRATGFTAAPQKFTRVPDQQDKLPAAWLRYCGSYGPAFIPAVVHEKYGHLYVTTENMVDYRLSPVTRHHFALPLGMYTDEFVTFLCSPDGHPHSLDFASMTLPRR